MQSRGWQRGTGGSGHILLPVHYPPFPLDHRQEDHSQAGHFLSPPPNNGMWVWGSLYADTALAAAWGKAQRWLWVTTRRYALITALSHHMFTPPPPTHTHVQPLPPTHTIYIYIVIREESFVESEQKASNTADCEWNLSLARTLMIVLKTVRAPHQYCLLFFHVAGTQTVLTFPISCDLEKLLAGATSCFSEDDNNRDLSSSSLRRKLFGKPDRQVWRTYPHWQGQSISSLIPRPPFCAGHSSLIPKPFQPHSQTILA